MFVEILSISGILLLVGLIVVLVQKIGREFFLISGIILLVIASILWYSFGINDIINALGIIGFLSFLIGGGEKLLKS